MEPPWNEPATATAVDVATMIRATDRWVSGPMAALNREIVRGVRSGDDFAAAVHRDVLPGLPPLQRCSPTDAKQLVVLLGLVGAGLGRHFQEQSAAHRDTPEKAFEAPFLEYFAALAGRTGTGHPDRDTYASLVRWSLPPVEARCGGVRIAWLPSVFDDGAVRTYTAAPDEVRFFELLKLSEALEQAVNTTLEPLYDLNLTGDEARERLDAAAAVLDALHDLNSDFAELPPHDALRPAHFMDVFRQFAVHWRPGDVPPSGALDPEAIVRDLLLGTPTLNIGHVAPALLDDERYRIAAARERPSLPDLILAACGGSLSIEDHPVLADTYRVLKAHARASGTHLRLARKYLFNPQRSRDAHGAGDPGVVSNRRGTTGMDEKDLERLTRDRHHHPLMALRHAHLPAVVMPAVEVSLRPRVTRQRQETM